MALLLRPKHRALRRCSSSIRFFSSNPEPPNSQTTPNDAENPQANSPFSDIKSSLKGPQSGSLFSRSAGSPVSSTLDDIGKRLAEYRRQSSDSSTRSPLTFQSLKNIDLLKDNKDNSTLPRGPTSGDRFDSIRESLQKMRISPSNIQPRINDSSIFRRGPNLNVGNIRETSFPASPASQFVRERMEKNVGLKRTGFVRSYTPPELGEKLRKLRPEVRTGKWFTLKELSERMRKLKEIEEKEMESNPSMRMIGEFRDILEKQKQDNDEKNRTGLMQKIDILARVGPNPNYMLSPPKERLVEQYFHPDNMSSAEKMKIELQKVRDKFKKSDSDCGSASVQVAQLTTKIKHLSSTLHKKDKHSRKGLQAMVQKRKKLLKYLRRTDWDSYAYLLSELGLRDNPDYKN